MQAIQGKNLVHASSNEGCANHFSQKRYYAEDCGTGGPEPSVTVLEYAYTSFYE
jgi:hypothetical protein